MLTFERLIVWQKAIAEGVGRKTKRDSALLENLKTCDAEFEKVYSLAEEVSKMLYSLSN